jgi:hypothetical protein
MTTARVQRIFNFIQSYLIIPSGKGAGGNFKLRPFQKKFIEIEKALHKNKLISIDGKGRVSCKDLKGLEKVLLPFGGVEKYCGSYTADNAPWKILTLDRQTVSKVGVKDGF